MQLDFLEDIEEIINSKSYRMERWASKIDKKSEDLIREICLFRQECTLLKMLRKVCDREKVTTTVPQIKNKSKLAADISIFLG